MKRRVYRRGVLDWRAIRRCTLAYTLCLLFGVLARADSPKPVLTIVGDRFAVNGEPRFLVFISYFDALRASSATLEKDFQYLRDSGFDGIRVFPNWWDERIETGFPSDTLLDGHGQLRPGRLDALKRVLDCAASHALLVDVSFAYETVPGISELRDDDVGKSQGELPVNHVHVDEYERGLTRIIEALRPYRNLFVDIQNEYNGRVTHLSDDEVRRLRAAIKLADPERLVTASLANEIGPAEVAQRSNAVGVDIVGWHESRNPWRFDEMDELVRRAKRGSSKPIYLGEPAPLEDGVIAENAITAVTKAKQGGAAAWTFHTHSSFDLSRGPLKDVQTGEERKFIESFAPRLRAAAWGSAGAAAAR